jgi:phosphohistidine swiveling domain-containing protein
LSLREEGKNHLMRGYALIRQTLLEMDRRCLLEGGIFFLTLEDLARLLGSDPGDPRLREEMHTLIAARKKRRDMALSLPVPQVLFSDDLEAIGRQVEVQGADHLQGVGLSAGVAEGTAWVLEEISGAQAPAETYILVCPSTDPAWVPLFGQARGLVMETGGVLSHGAIVARDFGLPAVAGIAEVHRRIKTGQRLRLDGASGKVSVLSA